MKTFAEPAQAGSSYLSELIIAGGKSADVCVVRALINNKLDRNHVRHHRLCVGIFPKNILQAVRSISDGQIVTSTKEDLLRYIVGTTGLLPILPPAANPRGSLVAKLNQQEIEYLKKLVPQEPQSSTTLPCQSAPPING
jgi:hypothetical protein